MIAWLLEQQRAWQEGLAHALLGLSHQGGLWAALILMLASFLYGVFHAAGPGHGKAVIATYLLTQPTRWRKAVVMSFAAAFCQGFVAITLVYGILLIAAVIALNTDVALRLSEQISYLFVMAMGAALAVRGLWRIPRRWRRVRSSTLAATPHHHDHHNQHHGHDHQQDAGQRSCGHNHGPDEAALDAQGWWAASLAVLAIGLRPCSGGVLVLGLAAALGLHWAGIAAVLLMSLGTGLTVAPLAVGSVSVRESAGWMLGRLAGGGPILGMPILGMPILGMIGRHGGDLVAIAGGLLLMVLGWGLLSLTFRPVHPVLGL